jgi:hypothetical protein
MSKIGHVLATRLHGIDHSINYSGRGANRARLAAAFDAQGIVRTRVPMTVINLIERQVISAAWCNPCKTH